jgi:hypothetical protein
VNWCTKKIYLQSYKKLTIGEAMGFHVFVVDRFSFPVHRSRGFCGVKNLPSKHVRYSVYADLKTVRVGDAVFFYQRRIDEPPEERGFRGIYEVVSEPFFDDVDVEWEGNMVLGKCPHCGKPYSETVKEKRIICRACDRTLNYEQHILPNRILIRPKAYFERPVDDNTAYINQTNHGTLPTMLFRKVFGPGRERSITHILPEEAEKLTRLLERVNKEISSFPPSQEYPPSPRKEIHIELGRDPKVRYESVLEAWMMENVDKDIPVLRDIIGPKEELEYFGNNVLYGIGGEKVDMLCLHKKGGIRYRATAIELKKDSIDSGAVEQIDRYSYWVSQLATANATPRVDSLLLQPVLIGSDVRSDVTPLVERKKRRQISIPYLWGECKVTVEQPVLLKYEVDSGKIEFEQKNIRV